VKRKKSPPSPDRCEDFAPHPEVVAVLSQKQIEEETVREMAEIFKVMADYNRIRILHALREKELCVCDQPHPDPACSQRKGTLRLRSLGTPDHDSLGSVSSAQNFADEGSGPLPQRRTLGLLSSGRSSRYHALSGGSKPRVGKKGKIALMPTLWQWFLFSYLQPSAQDRFIERRMSDVRMV